MDGRIAYNVKVNEDGKLSTQMPDIIGMEIFWEMIWVLDQNIYEMYGENCEGEQRSMPIISEDFDRTAFHVERQSVGFFWKYIKNSGAL